MAGSQEMRSATVQAGAIWPCAAKMIALETIQCRPFETDYD